MVEEQPVKVTGRRKLKRAWRWIKKKMPYIICLSIIVFIAASFDMGIGVVVVGEENYTDPSKFIPIPETFELLDAFIENQDPPDWDLFNITKCPKFEKFKKDNSDKRMQKNFNRTKFTFYGGPIYKPVVIRQLIEGNNMLTELHNPTQDYIKQISLSA